MNAYTPIPLLSTAEEQWHLNTKKGNAAFADGQYVRARQAYDRALTAAFDMFHLPSVPAATVPAPAMVNIACQNLAELCLRQDQPGQAALFLAQAFEKLAEKARCPLTPIMFRCACAEHLRFATAAFAEFLGEHAVEGYDLGQIVEDARGVNGLLSKLLQLHKDRSLNAICGHSGPSPRLN